MMLEAFSSLVRAVISSAQRSWRCDALPRQYKTLHLNRHNKGFGSRDIITHLISGVRKSVSSGSIALALAFGQAPAQPAALEDYFARVRAGEQPPQPSALLQPDRISAHLQTLAALRSDTVPGVRQQAIVLTHQIGLQASAVRAEALRQLLAAVRDPDSGNAGLALIYLTTYAKRDFTKPHQDSLLALFQTRRAHASRLIRLIGYLGDDRARPELMDLTANRAANRNDRWAAWLALSRMGDATALQEVLTRVKRLPVNDDLVYDILPDLIYTRQRAAIQYLIDVLNSQEPTCESADPEQPRPILCGYRVMELLAPVIENYPLQLSSGGDLATNDYPAALTQVRAWFTAHADFRILNDHY